MKQIKIIHMYIQELLLDRLQHLKGNIKRIEDGHVIGVSLEETTESFEKELSLCNSAIAVWADTSWEEKE
jgi:hypothetical protein